MPTEPINPDSRERDSRDRDSAPRASMQNVEEDSPRDKIRRLARDHKRLVDNRIPAGSTYPSQVCMDDTQPPTNPTLPPPPHPAGELWALCAGVDSYEDPAIQSLKYACRDARKLHQYLRAELGYRSSLLENKGENEFEAAMERIARKAKPGDTVLVYFGGHGINMGAELDNEQLLLFPKVRLSNFSTTKTAGVGGVRAVKTIIATAERFPELQWLFLFGVCNTSLNANEHQATPSGVTLRDIGQRQTTNKTQKVRNWSCVSACSPNQGAAEIEQLGHGLFEHCLFEAFKTANRAKKTIHFNPNFVAAVQEGMNSTLKLLQLNFGQNITHDLAPAPPPVIAAHRKNMNGWLTWLRAAFWRIKWGKLLALIVAFCALLLLLNRCTTPIPAEPDCKKCQPVVRPTPKPIPTPLPPKAQAPEECDSMSCKITYELSDGERTAKIETHLPKQQRSSASASPLGTTIIDQNRNYWVIGKTNKVLNTLNHSQDVNLIRKWKSLNIAQRWSNSVKIIAVGMASEEGETTTLEEWRSCARASTLRRWLESAEITVPSASLVLGQYIPDKNAPNSNAQRPVALIRIIKIDQGFNLEEALKRDLPNLPNWNIQLGNYSLGNGKGLQLRESLECDKPK